MQTFCRDTHLEQIKSCNEYIRCTILLRRSNEYIIMMKAVSSLPEENCYLWQHLDICSENFELFNSSRPFHTELRGFIVNGITCVLCECSFKSAHSLSLQSIHNNLSIESARIWDCLQKHICKMVRTASSIVHLTDEPISTSDILYNRDETRRLFLSLAFLTYSLDYLIFII